MISIRRLQVGEGELFKQIRLNALRESPNAFGSTYESALQRSPESWSQQADSTAQGDDRVTFIAFAGDNPVGITAFYRLEENPETGELLQVWVSPEYRGQGVALNIMEAIFQWAGEHSYRIAIARVAEGNSRAQSFYRKVGFVYSEGRSSDRSDPSVVLERAITSI